VAVPAPLARAFDYRAPANTRLVPGVRVRVPFGTREATGVVLETTETSDIEPAKIKNVRLALDREPLWSSQLLKLLHWVADYYHAPIGEVMQLAMPVLLRRGADPAAAAMQRIVLLEAGRNLSARDFPRAPKQWRLINLLREQPQGLGEAELGEALEGWRAVYKRLAERGMVGTVQGNCLSPRTASVGSAPLLSSDQQHAVTAIHGAAGGYQALLLHGVTGSGKTEVYLKAIEAVLANGGQVLVLVPEIGLTPQLVQRFESRLNAPIAVMHSALNDTERLAAWQAARTGEAGVVIGTRSAVFTPLPRLQLVIIDEEHDPSFKQQDGVRYHARDVAIKRASQEMIPVVLGSATPSLESVHNAEQGRYQWLSLPERAGGAQPPSVQTLDMRKLHAEDGFSLPLISALQAVQARGEQSLVFLNRRGFAPVLMCHDCGWLAPCLRCDARLTVHRGRKQLRCHHCGAEAPLPEQCPSCRSGNLHGLGEGTERIEAALAARLPKARIERIDRDSTRRKGSMEEKFARVHAGKVDILVGTQMLTKGHDFPNLTLVAVVNADQGLYSSDFRSEERLVQQLMQVAGRAGRADKPGMVLIQTWHPDNPVFQAIASHDYREFARYALVERNAAEYPPSSYFALLRAESPRPQAALSFLERARTLAIKLVIPHGVHVRDPVPSAMERRAGRYRAQLLVQGHTRPPLHEFLSRWRSMLDRERYSREVRWSLDVDPVDMN